MRALIARFITPSVDHAVADFHKAVARLESLADRHNTAAASNVVKITKLQELNAVIRREEDRARYIAGKIHDLVS